MAIFLSILKKGTKRLFRIGDDILHIYMGIVINHGKKIPIKQAG